MTIRRHWRRGFEDFDPFVEAWPDAPMHFIGTSLAIGLGVAASVGGSVVSGVLAKKGADTQAKAATDATAMATAEQRRQYEQARQDQMPWMTVGKQALERLQFLMGLGLPPQQAAQIVESVQPGSLQQLQRMSEGYPERFMQADGAGEDGIGRRFEDGIGRGFEDFQPNMAAATAPGAGGGTQNPAEFGSLDRNFSAGDFYTDPGYDFRLSEGAKALERSASARGGLFSGGTLKALTRYNQDVASQEYGNAFNRFQENRRTRYNQLAGIAGLGQQTAANLGNLGAQTSRDIANTTIAGMTSAAAARASGYNALGNIIGNASNLPLNWLALSRMNASSPGATGSSYPSGGYF